MLGDNKHFGKYGTVDKIIISSQGKNRTAFIQVYITYEKSSDAAFAIKVQSNINIGSGRYQNKGKRDYSYFWNY